MNIKIFFLFVSLFLFNSIEAEIIPKNSYVMGNNWYCNEGFKRAGNTCQKLNVPKNAYVMSNAWYCNEGFKRAGNTCQKLNVPKNAYVMSNAWYCNEGFKRIGNTCQKLNVPKNAYVMSNAWYCNEGFKRTGNTCQKLNVPKNAYVMSNAWYCNEGFKRTGNTCQKLNVPKNAYVMSNAWYCNEGFRKYKNSCGKLIPKKYKTSKEVVSVVATNQHMKVQNNIAEQSTVLSPQKNNVNVDSTGTKVYCQNLTRSEAQSYFLAGHAYLDADSDGIPCEWEEKETSHSKYTPVYTPAYTGSGSVYVRGYYRKNGTYVSSHTRSRPR